MTTIAEYVQQQGSEAVYAYLRSQPAFAVFSLCIHSPADILPACSALGLVTLDDAKAFALSLYNDKAATFAGLARPTVAADPDAPITIWPEIHNLLGDAGLLMPDCKVTHRDRNYRKPSHAEVVELAQKFPGRNRKYIAEVHDCDDFVKEFRGWLVSIGRGNDAVGEADIFVYTGDSFVSHGVCAVLTRDQGLEWIEPQGGHVYPLHFKRFAGQHFATKVLVHELDF